VAAPDGPRFGETSPTPDKGSLPIGHLSKPPLREVHAGGSSTPDPYADGAFTFERGEKTKHPEGTPLTALQRIQARKKPEPWYPSVDDWDLLPDAGR
jgi:hypothetical protein